MFDSLLLIAKLFILLAFILIICLFIVRKWLARKRNSIKINQVNKYGRRKKIIGFFHPYCNAGGGGEKVLWCLVYSILNNNKMREYFEVIIYSGESETKQVILEKAKKKFNVDVVQYSDLIQIIFVGNRQILEPAKMFTMLVQILGTFIYSFKCLVEYPIDIFFDSTGYPFSYFIVKLFMAQSIVYCYVHYPFISYDMINEVKARKQKFNNNTRIADSKRLSNLKLIYYQFLLKLYFRMGRYVDQSYVNSSWTQNHMNQIWPHSNNIKLYPPCQVDNFLKRKQFSNQPIIISFGQFRPEKQHKLQIEIMSKLLQGLPQEIGELVKLVKNEGINIFIIENDERYLNELKTIVKERKLDKHIEFYPNLDFGEMEQVLFSGMIGLHTMEYEHFGIALVELMACGLIMIAHNSAGPAEDIIVENEEFGYLCNNEEQFMMSIVKILQMSNEDRNNIVVNSRKRALQFSEQSFIEQFEKSMIEQFILVR